MSDVRAATRSTFYARWAGVERDSQRDLPRAALSDAQRLATIRSDLARCAFQDDANRKVNAEHTPADPPFADMGLHAPGGRCRLGRRPVPLPWINRTPASCYQPLPATELMY